MKDYETTRYGGDVARTNAIQAQQSAIGGALLGAGGTALGGFLGKAAPAAAGAAEKKAAAGTVVQGPEVTPGDSEANDVVPHKLSAGEMVVPKSVVAGGHTAVSEFAKKLLEIESNHGPSDLNGFAALVAMKPRKGK